MTSLSSKLFADKCRSERVLTAIRIFGHKSQIPCSDWKRVGNVLKVLKRFANYCLILSQDSIFSFNFRNDFSYIKSRSDASEIWPVIGNQGYTPYEQNTL